ncbi:TPA: ParA family protein [Aeromonas veronii]|uniref:ParA family protein n=1 Tax=Aeromonas TaxID=642 RepID=UPI001BD08F95|nr:MULTISPECIES: ParA family protein [Aeromonas]MBS4705183.1 ParA family protein [Aeromonas veronii]
MRKGKIVTLATQKGGTGKSTIALNIGHALHCKGVRVAIVDSDEQASAVSFYGQRRITANESELVGFDMGFPEVAKISSNAPYRKQLERITEFYDVVIVDTKGEFDQFQHDLLRMSDYVISPVQASEFDLEPTKLVRDAVSHENTQRESDEQLGLSYVLSKVNPSANSTKHVARLIGDMECHLMSRSIRTADVISAVSALGFTILDAAKNTSMINQVINKRRHPSERASFDKDQVLDIAESVNQIADELMERLK